jgi:hypothetical protein
MFGSKKMKRAKTKAFSSDKERKRFFAIKSEYAKSEGNKHSSEKWKKGK